MSKGSTRIKALSEEEVDDLVIAESEAEGAWEAPLRVKTPAQRSFSLPGDLAARAAFLARLHRAVRVDEWLARVIRERVELEELAFTAAKREISAGSAAQARAPRRR